MLSIAGDRLHVDELVTDHASVSRLLASQFPQWCGLALVRLPASGTDNVIYRLGPDLLVRLPRTHEAASRMVKEQDWLPTLAPQLPLPIPLPLAIGLPVDDYPVPWAVYPWLPGEAASQQQLIMPAQVSQQLAGFITVLHQLDPTHGPAPGSHNFFRGVPLAVRNAETLCAIDALHDLVDTAAVTAVWQRALAARPWQGSGVWIHGDLLPGNLLLDDGALTAVIDFGGLAIGDPACDLITAWSLFGHEQRLLFRQQLSVDDATWLRGMGWALSIGLIALPYYRDSNPAFAAQAHRMVLQVLDDDRKWRMQEPPGA